ncbi:glycosyltransferase family 4 protein [Pseudoneobacillus sp. C159]
MKILYVITGADIGGAQKHVMDLVSWFQKNGAKLEVVTGEEGPLVDWLILRGIPVKIIPIPRSIQPMKDWKAFWQLRQHLRRNPFNIVHCHSSKAGIIGRLAAFVCRVPKIIFTAHGFVFTDPTLSKKKKAFYIFLERLFGRFSSDIITVSQYDYLAGLGIGLRKQNLHMIHNGLPTEQVQSVPNWESKQAQLRTSDKKIIGFVGRLVPEKNIEMIIRIAEQFHRQALPYGVEFWLLGEGRLAEHYYQTVKEKGLTEIVKFWGNQTNVIDFMDKMHVMLITSHKEGLPYVLLEAMGRGLPVISTDVGGIKEVLDPSGSLELLVPLNDDNQMNQKLEKLLYHDRERERIGRILLQQASYYTADIMCKKIKDIY